MVFKRLTDFKQKAEPSVPTALEFAIVTTQIRFTLTCLNATGHQRAFPILTIIKPYGKACWKSRQSFQQKRLCVFRL
jgi:hypothetical protein